MKNDPTRLGIIESYVVEGRDMHGNWYTWVTVNEYDTDTPQLLESAIRIKEDLDAFIKGGTSIYNQSRIVAVTTKRELVR